MDVDIGIYVTVSSVGTYVQVIVGIPTAAHAIHGIHMSCCHNEEPIC